MPTYMFECDCGFEKEAVRPMSQSEDDQPCPHCGKLMRRDYRAELGETSGEKGSYLSEALGVHPSQIAEAKTRFPHHDFAPDGRMVIKSTAHRKRVLRDIGYADYG